MDDLYTRFDNVFFEKTRLSILMEKLIKAGYVEKRKELARSAVQTVYKITKEGRALFKEYLAFLEQMLKENR